jgi:very-short-patch-repair endonuclease
MGRLRGRKLKTIARSKLRKRKRSGWNAKISKRSIKKANSKRKRSSLEITVGNWLTEANIPFKREFPIGKCHVDIYLAPRTLIELQGCHWHGCMICNKILTSQQKVAQIKDARRFAFFRNRGYDVIAIWECEVKLEPDRVKQQLLSIYQSTLRDV